MLSRGSSIGRYLIKEKLAEGGMAEIYLASAVGAEGFAKDVAIKVVHPYLGSDPQFVEMFIAEARLASRLNHGNVVQIFDFGKDADRYFLVMEYVHGVSLAMLGTRCRELRVAVPPTLAADVCARVARGLHYAHALSEGGRRLGVVHRDVTPHNILLAFDGAVKISDFGIAKATTSRTAPGILKGKFAYMSPEQSRGEPVDARSDVFSLGIVLWELLTGERLFSGDSEVSVLRSVQVGDITPAADLAPDVPQELSDVVMKALSRDLEARYQSAFDLERALATFVLHSAKVVEDASVSDFLNQVFPAEVEHRDSTASPLDTLPPGGTDRAERRSPPPGTVTYTPSAARPGRASQRPGELIRLERATERPGLSSSARRTTPVSLEGDTPEDLDLATRGTEPVNTPKRGSTARMPRPGGSSRRLPRPPPPEPEPRGSGEQPADEDAEGELRVAQKRQPFILYIVGGVFALAIAVGALTAVLWRGGDGDAPSAELVTEIDEAPKEPTLRPLNRNRVRPMEESPVPATGVAAAIRSVDAGREVPPETAKVLPPTEPGPTLPPVVRVGRLTVKVVPFAIVNANGKELGEAYASATYPLKPGTYEIELVHPRKRVQTSVTIRSNEEVRLMFNAFE